MGRPEKKWRLFLVVAVGVFMSTLDSSMVNIALPAIMHEFGSPLHKTEWVVIIYLLTISISLLLWGHLSDRLGRGRIYPLGMFIFAAGSFCCGIAPSISWLIFFRCGQAIGAAMMMSTGPAIIKEAFATERLGRNLGLIGMAVSLGLMTGPAVGGLLIEYYSWRFIFFVTVPIGLVFFVFAGVLLSKYTPPPASIAREKFDWPGGVIWAIAITFILLAITHASSPDWSIRTLIAFIIFSGIAFCIFLKHEAVTTSPLLPFALLKKRAFSIAILTALLSFTVLFSVIMLVPFFLARVLELPGTGIGLIMMAVPLSVLIVAPLAGWLSDIVGPKYLSTAGLLVSTCSLFLLTNLTAQSTPLSIAGRLVLLGCGQAMFLSPNSASVLANVENNEAGISAGLLATARNMGMLLGVGLAGLVFSISFSAHTGGLDLKDFNAAQHSDSFVLALRASFYAATAIGLAATIISWLRGPQRINSP